jgi:3-dehydroquinate synthase
MKKHADKWRVSYQRTIEYDVVRSPNLFDFENTALLYPGVAENNRRFVVIDDVVEKYYADDIRNFFKQHGVEAKIVVFPSTEENKTLESYLYFVQELDAFPIHRRDEPIIAIGGGVLTDVISFVASSYRRSVPHIKVPTTLMGYVDASIGIKTGINFEGHKNRLGSFEPPLKVLLDKSFLKTLPKRHVLNGVYEIIKLAIIKDIELLALLEEYGKESVDAQFQNGMGDVILDRAISSMLEELEPNLYEDDLTRKVDFGHTFSYGLEIYNGSDLLHGEAVLLDIIVSLMIARDRDLLTNLELERIFKLIDDLGIILDISVLDPDVLWESLEERTCHRNGVQRVPMPDGLGNCVFLNDIELHEIQTACQALSNRVVLEYERTI